MSGNGNRKSLQERLEMNVAAFTLMVAFVVSIGGIVAIVPLFYLDSTWEDRALNEAGEPKFPELASVRPYTALELAGRDIFVREGCYTCHSQMIRPFRDEMERYGHYSLAVESKYDHPFQWGSKRTGPDLARVGGKYSDEWHQAHLIDPRSVVPESVMPGYPWLIDERVDGREITNHMEGLQTIGVPYTDSQIAAAAAEVSGKSGMDALINYLQVLGTMIKFEEGKVYRE
ncbi:Cytochrome c oxidase (cbb3-type) subunit CcoO [hydrothermal vent metagenome]|uniref:Cytochrome c oxidase (Cbb3-type) subunit CcoO n=1 Tax=hydrothermal vent metagenome TaxID=652676 RepID=A0A3B1D2A8_9ZZZZ